MRNASRTAGRRWPGRGRGELGFSLVETMISLVILLVALAGLFPPLLISISMNETQGNVATRATELSQDKMEGLMALTFTDPGLGGVMVADSTVGSVPPAAAVAGYVDYLDETGVAVAAPGFYRRQWSVSTDATGTLKTITVVVTAQKQVGPGRVTPSTTIICVKSSGL